MKIISKHRPVIYSNAFGDGTFRDKVKGFVEKQKSEDGILGKVKGIVSQGKSGAGKVGAFLGTGQQQAPPPPQYTPPPPPPPPKGMSKGLKIGLIVGGSVLVLGIIGFAIYKSKQNK